MEVIYSGPFTVAIEDGGHSTYGVVVADGPIDTADNRVSYGGVVTASRARGIARGVAQYIRQHPGATFEAVECCLLTLLAHLAQRQEGFAQIWFVDADGKKISWAAMTDLLDAAKARAGIPNG